MLLLLLRGVCDSDFTVRPVSTQCGSTSFVFVSSFCACFFLAHSQLPQRPCPYHKRRVPRICFCSCIAQCSSHLYHTLLCSSEGSKQMISRKEASVTVPHTVNPIGFGVGGGMSNDETIPTDRSPIAQLYYSTTEGSSVRSYSMEIWHYKEPDTPQSPDLLSPDAEACPKHHVCCSAKHSQGSHTCQLCNQLHNPGLLYCLLGVQA
jgi:hypothetical protein